MARILASPDPFPGQRPAGWVGPTNPDTPAWALDREPDNYDYDVPPDPAVAATVTPGANDANQGGSGTTNAFPGYGGTQPNGSSGAGGAYGHDAGAVNVSTHSSTSGNTVGGMETLNPPNFFPGGAQIPPGVPDTTGTTGPRRLRRDPSSGTMP